MVETARDTRARDEAAPYIDKPGPVSYSRAEVNAPMIWNFCEVVRDANPVYWDAEYAKQSRFGRLIAPPHMIMTMSSGHWWAPDYVTERAQQAIAEQGENPNQKISEIIHKYGYTTATNVTREDEFIAPYGPGDGRLKQQSRVVDVSEEKQTAVGKGVFITTIIEYRTEVGDRLVVRAKNVLLMYDSSKPRT